MACVGGGREEGEAGRYPLPVGGRNITAVRGFRPSACPGTRDSGLTVLRPPGQSGELFRGVLGKRGLPSGGRENKCFKYH